MSETINYKNINNYSLYLVRMVTNCLPLYDIQGV